MEKDDTTEVNMEAKTVDVKMIHQMEAGLNQEGLKI